MDIEKLRSVTKDRIGKSVTYKVCSFNQVANNSATKAEDTEQDSGNVIYPIINTTNFLDSHGDVHAKGIWGEEPIEGISYIIDHNYGVDGLVASPKDVRVYVERLRWKQLGLDINGTTDALRFEVTLQDYANDKFVKALKAGVPLQNSVRMIYEDLSLCVNNSDFKDEYANWNKYLKEVANQEDAMELGYFWYVKKARVFLEGSAVLRGSNNMTPMQTKEEENTGDEPITNKEEGVKTTPVWLNLM
ncbi:MAG TPA: hypothetical protein VNR38_00915 [Ureibacillus sp.]|nr:hypothetical protein [Ureibacillus sp.]